MPSFTYRIIEKIIQIANIKAMYSKSNEEILEFCNKRLKNQSHKPSKKIYKQCNVETFQKQSQPCYKIIPTNPTKRAIFFIHGGGFVMEINSLHWEAVRKFAVRKNQTVYVPIYALSPKATAKDAFEMIEDVYDAILKEYEPSNITMVGDSAGGQMALSFCQQCMEENKPLPGKLVLLSPPVDMKPEKEVFNRMLELEKEDPMISCGFIDFVENFWAGDLKMDEYHLSPLKGKLEGMPPMDVFCGTKEVIYPVVLALHEKAKQEGVQCNLHIGQDMMHIWPYFLVSKEAKEAFIEVCDCIPE